ncbi:MAG: UDP-N-acetylmuramoyl-tripeptide--D-alanyl-D-alanine ligase [Muribaculaceae bacterium]|nr:UDP-N-acetylmuramoyl-tripeptide--D-alanyl-D-alanine ligase [Muribaculaceae bacterium]
MSLKIVTYAIILIITTVVALCLVNLIIELRRCLMMFQQNSYRPERYNRWLKESGDSTSTLRLFGIIVLMLTLSPFCNSFVVMMPLVALFSIVSIIKLSRRKYKKPLVMTKRAYRIIISSLLIVALASSLIMTIAGWDNYMVFIKVLLAAYCLSHAIILAANYMLTPIEKRITKRYCNEAASILAAMPDLKIIGVTGSYGKTTTKHYLHRILSEQFETIMTPGSFNTTLGVVRTIREMLKPYHEVFIVEMGAKQTGDIREICDLVHPWGGVITAVGPQHLESFKSIDNVQATKFELADALPSDGLAVINNDFEKISDRIVTNTKVLRYAVKNTEEADYIASNIEYSPIGTRFDIIRCADGHKLSLYTHLVGECNISNILAAVAVAHSLGVSDERIAYAVEKIEQVEHRLSIKRIPGGLTIIDDAFNSNPVGSAMALDVLASMKGGRRFLITPGMIELGDEQQELNRQFGFKAASCCDIAIVVGRYNRDAIVNGLTEGGMALDSIHQVDSFAQAQSLLTSMAVGGDTILYENDLPDTFK